MIVLFLELLLLLLVLPLELLLLFLLTLALVCVVMFLVVLLVELLFLLLGLGWIGENASAAGPCRPRCLVVSFSPTKKKNPGEASASGLGEPAVMRGERQAAGKSKGRSLMTGLAVPNVRV